MTDARKKRRIEKINKQLEKQEQIEYERKIRKERLEVEIGCIQRDMAYKQNQVDTGLITETRAINQIPGNPAIILDGYSDGLKPKHILENEIEQHKLRIKEKEEQIANIKKLEEENATEPTEP